MKICKDNMYSEYIISTKFCEKIQPKNKKHDQQKF